MPVPEVRTVPEVPKGWCQLCPAWQSAKRIIAGVSRCFRVCGFLFVKRRHERDLARGVGRAVLPFALDRKYQNASTDWAWQFVFPAARICRDPQWGPPSRFHPHESVVQRNCSGIATSPPR